MYLYIIRIVIREALEQISIWISSNEKGCREEQS